MLGLLQPRRLPLLCAALLSCSLPRRGLAGPPGARDGPPEGRGGEGVGDRARRLLVDSVKAGILGYLGADREPRPAARASEEQLRRMHRRYEEEKLRLLRGNWSAAGGEVRRVKKPRLTVLFPETVDPVRAIHREGSVSEAGQRLQWYRAVFRKNSNAHADLSLVRAKLKISSWRWEAGRAVRVALNRRGPLNTTVRTAGTVGRRHRLPADLRAEVEAWWRGGGRGGAGDLPLVVEVGLEAGGGSGEEGVPRPSLALELGLARAGAGRHRRLPRSNKEDVCAEQGWCCRKALTVSFKDIGWSDWVVAPLSYTMHYCDGACPHNYKPAAMHTQVKSRLHQLSKGAAPAPCCVPGAYEPLVLMHYDSRGLLTLTPFPDMIVTKCYCA